MLVKEPWILSETSGIIWIIFKSIRYVCMQLTYLWSSTRFSAFYIQGIYYMQNFDVNESREMRKNSYYVYHIEKIYSWNVYMMQDLLLKMVTMSTPRVLKFSNVIATGDQLSADSNIQHTL